MKPLFVLMLFFALLTSASGQTQSDVPAGQKCSLTLAQSPTIRGLKLGMDVEEVLRQFPGRGSDPTVRTNLLWADKQFGVARFNAPTHPYHSESRFAGILQFDFEILDKRVSGFSILYDGPEWRSIDEFVARIAESLNLPGASYWTPSNLPTLKTLKCAGFEISAWLGSPDSHSLRIRDTAAEQIVKDRQIEAKEKARKDFKP